MIPRPLAPILERPRTAHHALLCFAGFASFARDGLPLRAPATRRWPDVSPGTEPGSCSTVNGGANR